MTDYMINGFCLQFAQQTVCSACGQLIRRSVKLDNVNLATHSQQMRTRLYVSISSVITYFFFISLAVDVDYVFNVMWHYIRGFTDVCILHVTQIITFFTVLQK